MSEIYRYRIQRKIPYAMPCIIGNHSMPLPTYKWVDIMATGDLKSAISILESYSLKEREIHRIEDSNTGEVFR